ncbi:free methionine-R-sulfoxide reductase [[Candida] anglica]
MSETHHADYSNYSENISKEEMLTNVVESYSALAYGIDNWVANLSNCASLLWHGYHSAKVKVNWTGFYVVDPKDSTQLILAPFQGKVACQQIRIGSGVCGAAASTLKTQLVPDVNKFPGHIACDGETQSEIVVPILDKAGKLVGVLDLDCLTLEGFDELDQKYLEDLCKSIGETCSW